MSNIDLSLVTAQPFFACSLVLYGIGWFITFIASCIIGSSVRLFWVSIFYNLFLLLGAALAVATNSVHQYRLVLLTFIAGSISLLFIEIDAAINVGSTAIYFGGSSKYSAAGAGLIFQALALLFWVVYFGADEDSLAKRKINGFTTPRTHQQNGGVVSPAQNHVMVSPQQQFQQPHYQDHNNMSPVPVNATAVVNMNGNGQHATTEYAYKAKALYSYEANPEDRNELAFVKGEILDIVDNKGKWWQARKADGTVGIAPSNYLQLI
ncbi:Transmembrane osmosensor [Gryganskiella cystojenkinii]|nr:Transmembrane osmosensor [Gryganskiella cystojenkinii]